MFLLNWFPLGKLYFPFGAYWAFYTIGYPGKILKDKINLAVIPIYK